MKKPDDSVATDTAFIALLFIDKLCLVAVPSESIQGVSSAVDEDWVKECLPDLDQCKSMGPDGLHPSMLRELADAVVMLPCTIFEKSWRSRSSLTTGMQMLHSSSERWVNLISVWAKPWDSPLGSAGHVKVICNGQGGFVSKSKSCLRSLSAFYDDYLCGQGESNRCHILQLVAGLLSVSLNILSQLGCCDLDGWAMRWV